MKKFFHKIFNWERWSFDAIYSPVSFVWLYYAIKARAFWFFTPVNPSLVFAGFEGASKAEMYKQMPKWCLPVTLFIDNATPFDEVKAGIGAAGLEFPIVAKPDTGMGGVLFRVLNDESSLQQYHEAMCENYILQTFVQLPAEFSVFHIRYPGETKGIVTGLVAKNFLQVTGDGKRTLSELVASHPIAMHKTGELKRRHAEKWNYVPAANENYILSYAGNHRVGARFINMHNKIDQQLCDVFDKISNEIGQFYFGRYDLKCTSLEDLKNGKNIQILEFNGAGAVAIHIFDCNMSYWQALKEIVKHWDHLYRIGKINNKRGVRYWTLKEGFAFLKNCKRNYKRLLAVDASLP
jgi:hypothetical protein